jgi:antitoxin MazE
LSRARPKKLDADLLEEYDVSKGVRGEYVASVGCVPPAIILQSTATSAAAQLFFETSRFIIQSNYCGGIMEAKLIAIGNSRGVRLPKKILEAANLDRSQTVTLTLTKAGLLLSAATKPREGWEAAAKQAAQEHEDLWEGLAPWNETDEMEWTW